MIISVFKLCIFCISHHLHVSFLLRVKVNSTNWPSPNVRVFIAQLVEQSAALTYTMPGLGMNFLFFFLSTPEQRTIFSVKKEKTGHNLYLVKSWISSSFV